MINADGTAAWQAMMPADVAWLRPRSRRDGQGLHHQLSSLPSGALAGVARGGWLGGSARILRRAGVRDIHTYAALPSCRRPVVVADREPALLQYVSESLLTVPPGAGPLASIVFTVGLRLLRLPGSGALARAVLPGRTAVGRIA
jgi:hypothetical protein